MRMKHALDAFDVGAEPFGDFGNRADEISGLVQRVDQRRADHAFGRIGKQDRGLTLKMVAKRHGFGDVSFEVRGLASFMSGADARPGLARSSRRQARTETGGAVRSASKAFSTSVPRLAARWPASVSSASPAQSPGSGGASAKPLAFGLGLLEARLLTLLRRARAAGCSPIRSR